MSAFQTARAALMQLPPKARLAEFWDLETQSGLGGAEQNAAALCCGIALLAPIDQRTEAAAYGLTWRVLAAAPVPGVIRCVVDFSLVNAADDVRPSPRTLVAARSALEWLMTKPAGIDVEVLEWFGGRDRIVECLAGCLRVAGDFAGESLACTAPGLGRDLRSRFEIRQALCRGGLDEAFERAVQDFGGDSAPAQWLEALLARDYRRLTSFRGADATLESRLRLWLLSVVYPTTGSNSRSIAGPGRLRRIHDLDGQPRAVTALLALALVLEEFRAGRPEAAEELLGREFHARLMSLQEPDLALVVMLAASTLAAGNAAISAHFQNLYRVTSQTLSQGLAADLLYTRDALPGLPQVTPGAVGRPPVTGRLARGVRLSGSTLKLMSAIATAKIQSLLTRDRQHRNALKAGLAVAVRQFIGEVSELRGLLQKVVQLGQALHADLPFEWRDELAKGLNQPQPLSGDQVRSAVAAAIPDASGVLADLDPAPFACGSIGQVHRARLADGTEVCVKVRLPGIETAIRADFRNLRALLPLLRRLLPNQPLKEIAANWESGLLKECDFAQEARHYNVAAKVLAGLPVVVPRAFESLSGPAVLVTEFVPGLEFFEFLAQSTQAERDAIGVSLWRSIYVLLAAGRARDDVQPANYKVHDGRLVLLDFGSLGGGAEIAGYLSHLRYMRAFAKGDTRRLADLLEEEGWCPPQAGAGIAESAMVVLGRPFRGGFEFSEDYVREVYRVMTGVLAPHVTMPATAVSIVRVFWSLFSMLAMLRARADWAHELRHELELDPVEDAAKSA